MLAITYREMTRSARLVAIENLRRVTRELALSVEASTQQRGRQLRQLGADTIDADGSCFAFSLPLDGERVLSAEDALATPDGHRLHHGARVEVTPYRCDIVSRVRWASPQRGGRR